MVGARFPNNINHLRMYLVGFSFTQIDNIFRIYSLIRNEYDSFLEVLWKNLVCNNCNKAENTSKK